jgi:hypothetical protein
VQDVLQKDCGHQIIVTWADKHMLAHPQLIDRASLSGDVPPALQAPRPRSGPATAAIA